MTFFLPILSCHSEQSEESEEWHKKILRFTQEDIFDFSLTIKLYFNIIYLYAKLFR